MSFKDIQGQPGAVSFLEGSVRNGKLANAYIFSGPAGVGKSLAALNFAKAINCLVSDDGISCDNCSSCRKIDSLNHPDVFVMASEKERISIKIDDIRSLIESIGLKPYESKRKLYIIDESDALTEQAANALLKTLEEPSVLSTLVLITENRNKLLPTIRSRCQDVRFYALTAPVVEDMLVALHKIDRSEACLLARVSCGSPGYALRLNNDNFFSKRKRIISSLVSGAFSDMEFDRESKADLITVLGIMLTWYRDILVAKSGGMNLINIDKEDDILAEALRMDAEKLDRILKGIISTQAYLDQNANPKLAMAALGTMI